MNNPIIYEEDNQIATITLNRVSKHNAFNSDIVVQLTQIYEKVNRNAELRVVVLRANGKHFSAGADLEWMRSMKQYSLEENQRDAECLCRLLAAINDCGKPTIAITQGKVIGGAVGLAACCDFVLALPETEYCFSEVTLGLIPATIAPYVLRKVGYGLARSHFISAEPIDAKLAKSCGLVYAVANDPEQLEQHYQALSQRLLRNGPHAMTAAKCLLECLHPIDDEVSLGTAQLLAEIRVSEEAQSRLNQFLNKE